jgi:hypothetical protein
MAQLGRAATSDDVLIWEHGRRLGIVGDGQSGDPSALILDGKVIASNRLATGVLFKFITAVAVGPITLAGAQPGDTVAGVIDLTSDADGTATFESTITVAGQIQQIAASTDKFVVLVLPRS